jgi:hypothetical protein
MFVPTFAVWAALSVPPDWDWKRQPSIAPIRKEMADAYRALRRDRPAFARLLFRRLAAAKRAFAEHVMSGAFEGESDLPDLRDRPTSESYVSDID